MKQTISVQFIKRIMPSDIRSDCNQLVCAAQSGIMYAPRNGGEKACCFSACRASASNSSLA